jgi:OPA family sugar phosphate sensor protein UhpC-like MFS transporter
LTLKLTLPYHPPQQVKGVADAGAASLRVSGLELGGLLGSLLAGRLSDALVARAPPGAGTVGMRVRVIIGYTFGIALSLLAFAAAPASATWAQWASVFAIGFFLYGPQMMIGLCGAELVRPESVGASQGFLGWVAYLGAANAGIPLSFVVRGVKVVLGASLGFTTRAPGRWLWGTRTRPSQRSLGST